MAFPSFAVVLLHLLLLLVGNFGTFHLVRAHDEKARSTTTTTITAIANVSKLFHTTTSTTTSSTICDGCHRFDGIGGLSGGGGTSRLLIEYPPDVQSEILDFLFKPNFGASLHILKVEIGGDAQSTDGSESSHMHSQHDLNLHRGYEWWLLREAKQRNPSIITYGLPWAFPGWITNDKQNPFEQMDKVTNYTLQWVKGAKEIHGIEIDYLGIWNEIGTSRDYLLALRKVLDENGFTNVKLVSNDGQPEDLLPHLLVNDTDYINAIDVFGFHYPHDDHTSDWILANSFSKPIWSSEESSSYDDENGAACWARVVASHYVLNNMTANIMWNLLGSYMHGTNWYASSMLTAVQPWTGYYGSNDGQMPVVWATAHYTQFVQPGWQFLPVGQGSGELATGGYYVTLVSPDLNRFTVIVVKISRDHAPCTRPGLWDWDTDDEIFHLTIHLPPPSHDGNDHEDDDAIQTWYSNLEAADTKLFEKIDSKGGNNGLSNVSSKKTSSSPGGRRLRSYDITLNVTVGSIFTVTNQANVGYKGQAKVRRDSNAMFPLPYYDDFNNYTCNNCLARYLSDQMGAYEIIQIVDKVGVVDNATTNDDDESRRRRRRRALVQMTPELPVMWWQKQKDRGPVTVMGMTEWEDIQVEASFRLPDPWTAACVATRTDQYWDNGVSFCVNTTHFFLTYGGANLVGFDPSSSSDNKNNAIAYGNIATAMSSRGSRSSSNDTSVLSQEAWHTIILTTKGHQIQGVLNGVVVTSKDLSIRVGDSGFVALGISAYAPVQFGHIKIQSVGEKWSIRPDPPEEELSSSFGLGFCTPNGLSTDQERFELTANWQIRHVASGLCTTVVVQADEDDEKKIAPVSLTLQPCIHDHAPQQFRHDYTQIRNGVLKPLKNALGDLCATRNGQVSLTMTRQTPSGPSTKVSCAGSTDSFFSKWALYPNTQQLRISFGYSSELGGRSKCLQAKQGGTHRGGLAASVKK